MKYQRKDLSEHIWLTQSDDMGVFLHWSANGFGCGVKLLNESSADIFALALNAHNSYVDTELKRLTAENLDLRIEAAQRTVDAWMERSQAPSSSQFDYDELSKAEAFLAALAQQKQEGYAMHKNRLLINTALGMWFEDKDPVILEAVNDFLDERYAEGFKAGQEAMRERAAKEAIACDDDYGLGIASEIRALSIEQPK
jgi:hypothetical protein